MKVLIRLVATLCILPHYLAWIVMAQIVGGDRALFSASQGLARVPGLRGRYLRAAFLRLVLEYCDPTVSVEVGSIFSKRKTRLGANVYIGPYCQIGQADIGEETMLAAGVHVPSGPDAHGTARLDVPMRLQPGTLRTVKIGRDCWIGSTAVVMADVGEQSIVAAGAVVTSEIPARVIAGGVPAKVLKNR